MSKYSRDIDLNDTNSAATKIIDLVGKGKKVLEFGCAGGHMSRVLKERCRCRVVGIEIDPQDAKEALAYCEEVIVGDIEDLKWCTRLSGRKFDVAVFADVLEHLKRPERPLERVGDLLEKDGYVLVSVPNIANVSVRLELLAGGFEYESLGILDDTHLKYFTLKSIIGLVEGAGLYVESLDYSIKDLPERIIVERLRPLGLTPTKKTINNFSTVEALAFEFILKARPYKPKGYVPYTFKETKKPQRVMEEVLREQVRRNRDKNKHIANLEARLEDQKRHIRNLEKELRDSKAHARNVEDRLKDRERHIKALESERSDRRRHIENIEKERKDRERHIRNLEAELKDRKKHISNLESLRIDRGQHIANLEEMARQRETRLIQMENELGAKTAMILRLEKDLCRERGRAGQLKRASVRLGLETKELKVQLGRKEGLIAGLEETVDGKKLEVMELKAIISGLEETVRGLNADINSLEASLSWRVTRPFRTLGHLCRRACKEALSFLWRS